MALQVRKGCCRVKATKRSEEEYWQATHENVPCPPRVMYRNVRYHNIAGYTQLLGEATLTGVMPSIEYIDNYLSAHLDVSRAGARKSTRERERLRVVRAVYWDILWTVQGKKVNPKQSRIPRPPDDITALARHVLKYGMPDEPEPTDTDFYPLSHPPAFPCRISNRLAIHSPRHRINGPRKENFLWHVEDGKKEVFIYERAENCRILGGVVSLKR